MPTLIYNKFDFNCISSILLTKSIDEIKQVLYLVTKDCSIRFRKLVLKRICKYKKLEDWWGEDETENGTKKANELAVIWKVVSSFIFILYGCEEEVIKWNIERQLQLKTKLEKKEISVIDFDYDSLLYEHMTMLTLWTIKFCINRVIGKWNKFPEQEAKIEICILPYDCNSNSKII